VCQLRVKKYLKWLKLWQNGLKSQSALTRWKYAKNNNLAGLLNKEQNFCLMIFNHLLGGF
jgi:hypothetical protein